MLPTIPEWTSECGSASSRPSGTSATLKGASKDIIDKVNAAAVAALDDPAVRARLIEPGYQIFPRERQTPEALAAMVKADAERWWPVIRELRLKANPPPAPPVTATGRGCGDTVPINSKPRCLAQASPG